MPVACCKQHGIFTPQQFQGHLLLLLEYSSPDYTDYTKLAQEKGTHKEPTVAHGDHQPEE